MILMKYLILIDWHLPHVEDQVFVLESVPPVPAEQTGARVCGGDPPQDDCVQHGGALRHVQLVQCLRGRWVHDGVDLKEE